MTLTNNYADLFEGKIMLRLVSSPQNMHGAVQGFYHCFSFRPTILI